MSRARRTQKEKAQDFVSKYPIEFGMHPKDELVCNYCNVTVTCSKGWRVEKHKKTKAHQDAQKLLLNPKIRHSLD